MIGSHLDTVPHAGAFDGILGVMMGIALVEGKPAISDFTLSIPLAKGFADLYRPNRAIIHPDKANVTSGTIPSEGVAHDWRPNVWIGNTRRGARRDRRSLPAAGRHAVDARAVVRRTRPA